MHGLPVAELSLREAGDAGFWISDSGAATCQEMRPSNSPRIAMFGKLNQSLCLSH
jgi:hypothetical protein